MSEKSPEQFLTERMNRRRFLAKAGKLGGVLGLGAMMGGMSLPASGLDPAVNWRMEAGSPAILDNYTIFDDGTGEYFAKNGLTGSVHDVSAQTDFGALFNAVMAQLPAQTGTFYEGTGGQIGIRKSANHYKYSTTPLVSKSYVRVVGAGRGTILEPSAAVDGLTLQSPAGAGLVGNEISNLGFYDPSGNGVGKGYIVLDSGTNAENIVHGIIDSIYFWGGPNNANSTGKLIQQKGAGVGAFGLNGSVADFVISRLMAGSNFLQYAGSAPNLPMYASDSIIDYQSMFDCTFRDWLVAFHDYKNAANPWVNGHNATAKATGNQWYNVKLLADTTPNNTIGFLLDNLPNAYIEDLFFEVGVKPGSGSVGVQIKNAASEIRVRRIRVSFFNKGIQWAATATSIDRQYFNFVDVAGCDVGFESVAGDASKKTFIGGFIDNTTNFSPNPLTNAVFEYTSVGSGGGQLVQGWNVATPAIPATNVAVTNSTDYDVFVHLNTQSVTDVKIDGVSTGWTSLPADLLLYLPNGHTITLVYAGAAPTWKWYGD